MWLTFRDMWDATAFLGFNELLSKLDGLSLEVSSLLFYFLDSQEEMN